jgi:hypothetical protein
MNMTKVEMKVGSVWFKRYCLVDELESLLQAPAIERQDTQQMQSLGVLGVKAANLAVD